MTYVGDPDPSASAFTELARRYRDMAFGYALATLRDFHLAQDVTQEALFIAYCNLARLDDVATFPAWLRGIVRHQCGRVLRTHRFDLVPLDEGLGVPARTLGPEQHAEDTEAFRRVLSAIGALPRAQREVAALFYIKDYSQREIAAFLELPVTTVNNRLHAARKGLKERLLTMSKTIGQVIKVGGVVVDAQCEPDSIPALLSGLALANDAGGSDGTLQVIQRLDHRHVRCLVRGATTIVTPGRPVVNTDAPMPAPIDARTLDQVIPLLGNVGQEDRATDAHARAGAESTEVLETGIKVIDLMCPYPRGGKIGLFGPSGCGRVVVAAEILRNAGADGTGPSVFAFLHGEAEGMRWYEAPSEVPNPLGAGQLICLPIDDPVDSLSPTYLAASALLDATTHLSRNIGAAGIWPAVDPLLSASRMLDPALVGQEHYEVACGVRRILRRYEEMQQSTPDGKSWQLSPEEHVLAARARRIQRFFSQPFSVAEPFTQRPGQYVSRADTVRAFKDLLAGAYDDLPEQAFLWRGALPEQVRRTRS